jgi:Spy/CpxP family protein refolding chaperone
MMNNVRSFVFALSLGAASVVAVGCGGSVEQPQTQASAASKAPIAQNTHGVVKMFGAALGEVALRPEQRTEIEKLALAADQRHAAMGDGRKELMLAVAAQIESGAIDKAALQPKIDRIVADMEKGRPEDNAALARVHAILDPEQRNAFVDALEAHFKGGFHGGKAGHHGGKGKHHGGEGGEHAKGGEHGKGGEAGEHHARMGGMMGLKQLSDDLKLTDEQKTKIFEAMKAAREANKGDHEGMRERMGARMGEGKKALESFRTDTFDPNAAAPSADKLRAQVSEGSTRMLGMAETVLPILTPEQRKVAAEKVRTMATAGAEMPFGH